MLIRIGYDIRFELAQDVSFLAAAPCSCFSPKGSCSPDDILTDPFTPVEDYRDSFGNTLQPLSGTFQDR